MLAQGYCYSYLENVQGRNDRDTFQKSPANVVLSHQGRLLKVQLTTYGHQIKEYHNGSRGAITCFTRRSRKRLIELMARLEIDSGATFITLTYGQVYPTERNAKRHLTRLLKRIKRAHPQANGVWRMEYQTRGAPHFHLLLFDLPYLPKWKLAAVWASIIGDEFCDHSGVTKRPPFTRVEFCQTARKVTRYLTKYVAKVATSDRDSSGFNNVPYLTGTMSDDDFVGRFWGVFNRAALHFAPLFVMSVTHALSFYKQFKRAAAHQFKRIASYPPHHGFTLFTEFGDRWRDYLLYCVLAFT